MVIKDCCDGSDEYSGRVTCPNTCSELAAKMREEQERIRKLKEEGFAKRKELIEAATNLKKDLQVKQMRSVFYPFSFSLSCKLKTCLILFKIVF